jgi:hypothetical protein
MQKIIQRKMKLDIWLAKANGGVTSPLICYMKAKRLMK